MTQVLVQLFTRWQGAIMADSQMQILQACMRLTRLVQPVKFKYDLLMRHLLSREPEEIVIHVSL